MFCMIYDPLITAKALLATPSWKSTPVDKASVFKYILHTYIHTYIHTYTHILLGPLVIYLLTIVWSNITRFLVTLSSWQS